ncbi:MarR family winged helix-turn-helix transcriptional regulator [Streptomyces abyssomicinicus]|uniref:MarR family winged helix-turn-helix transcriptional regulator n=1 Tax=Streptomyces abyssomicinicus TaxID=574929 RepID=UPI0012508A6C|nr:MarR family transcriptional regulator [Streptomyces abyssomicinicus]
MATAETESDDHLGDWADRHLSRRRDHAACLPLDDEVEAITVRLERVLRHLRQSVRHALDEVGLQNCAYETLHLLMIRDTPGRATPSALAADLGVSGAGMTGRLDALERAGWVRRTPATGDRRRVDVVITEAGEQIWRRATVLRGRAESRMFDSLRAEDRACLAALLRQLTLRIELPDGPAAD